MKAFRILSRNIRDSFQSVFRNFSLSLASISCITITLLVVSISMILSVNVNNFASLVEKDKEQDSEITDLKDLVNSLADSNITTEEKTYILSQLTIYGTDISVLKQDVVDLRKYSDIQDQAVYDSIKSIGDQSIAELF